MIKFLITGQQLAAVTPGVIVSDTLDYISAKFDFVTADWTGLTKVAYFISPDTTVDPFYVILVDDEITPSRHVALSAGNWQIYVVGLDSTATAQQLVDYLQNGTTYASIDQRITTSTVKIKVEQALNGGTFPLINLTVSEQLATICAEVKSKSDSGSYDGATFTPTVDDSGNISWTNDKQKPNPTTKNIKGPKGDTGDTGTAATIAVGTTTTGAAGTSAMVSNVGTSSAAIFNFVIPKGDKGDTGSTGPKGDKGDGFRVLGYYSTLAELQAAVTSPNAGDAYGVGTAAPYEIYIWNGVTSTWVDNGTIQGAKGDPGAAATVTVGSTSTGAAGSSASVTNSGTTSAAVLNFTIPKGDKGDTGNSGVSVSTSQPTDPNVRVWINPDGDASSISANMVSYESSNVDDALDGLFADKIDNPSSKSNGQILEYNGTTWVAADKPTSGVWGQITGTLSDQIDLSTALSAKQNTIINSAITLAVADWSNYTQTVSVSGVTTTNIVVISPSPSSFADYTDAVIYCSAQGSDTLTFTCSNVPANAITVNVMIVG